MCGVGKARRDRLLTAAMARAGDALVLSKAAGLEGSHILANDFLDRLAAVVPPPMLEEARSYEAELSVVREARFAVELGATAMHDPTEGGVLGALWEMAEASGVGFRVQVARIAVREPTRLICEALGADPLRLIASGALLIACRDGAAMVAGLQADGIEATGIGQCTDDQRRLLLHADGRVEELTELPRDELYRLLEMSR
jgi:hydrogenase maturation factor